MGEQHSHDAEVNDHEHVHVTHYLSGGQDWTHRTSGSEIRRRVGCQPRAAEKTA